MAESIAILLGNSKYRSLNHLNCVKNDLAEMKKLITATGKFSNIHVYLDRPISEVKDELKELAKSHKHTAELFFYFSGHGHSDQDNFYMCFSDFSEVTPNRSGLSRDEAYELNRPGFAGDCLVLLKRLYRARSGLHSMPPLPQLV